MGNPMTELRDVTCHMGSHSFTCHLTHVNAPCLNPSQWKFTINGVNITNNRPKLIRLS